MYNVVYSVQFTVVCTLYCTVYNVHIKLDIVWLDNFTLVSGDQWILVENDIGAPKTRLDFLIVHKGMTFDHVFGYSLALFSSLPKIEGRRKWEWIAEIVIKSHAFLVDFFLALSECFFPCCDNNFELFSIAAKRLLFFQFCDNNSHDFWYLCL